MKFTNEGRKEVTFAVCYEGRNAPFQQQTVHPGETVSFAIGDNANAAEITVRGGVMFGGESKEFSTGELRSIRSKLESAKTVVRSPTVRDMLDDVIDRLGY